MAKTSWGNWTLNVTNACLEYVDPSSGSMFYQVDVDEMTTSAEILDWIFQIEEKTWASSAVVGDFVAAIAEILGREVAGGGVDRPIDPKIILTANYGIKFS